MDSTAGLAVLLQGCLFLLLSLFQSTGMQVQELTSNRSKLEDFSVTADRALPMGRQQEDVGGWSVFSSCTTCAGCTFIYHGDSLTTQAYGLVPRWEPCHSSWADRQQGLATAQRCFLLLFDCLWWVLHTCYWMVDWVWVSGGVPRYLKCNPGVVSTFLSCSIKSLYGDSACYM